MAPSTKVLEGKLRTAVDEVFNSDIRDQLTVRLIRNKVEEELELEDGFFVQEEWKEKSKRIIKEWAVSAIRPNSIFSHSYVPF